MALDRLQSRASDVGTAIHENEVGLNVIDGFDQVSVNPCDDRANEEFILEFCNELSERAGKKTVHANHEILVPGKLKRVVAQLLKGPADSFFMKLRMPVTNNQDPQAERPR